MSLKSLSREFLAYFYDFPPRYSRAGLDELMDF